MHEGLIITTPHSSVEIPEEIRDRFALSTNDFYLDSDAGTYVTAISAVPEAPNIVLPADFHRFVADLNRKPDDPLAIRLKDFHKKRIFHEGRGPNEDRKKRWIAKYHAPWHEKLSNLLKNEIRLLIDLHNSNPTNTYQKTTFHEGTHSFSDFTDFDIGIRADHLSTDPLDTNGLTFPANEIESVVDIIKKSLTSQFPDIFQNQAPRVTVSAMWPGGYVVQKARDEGNWQNGIPRAIMLEPSRTLMETAGTVDMKKVEHMATIVRQTIDQILTNTLPQY